jgi:hypothetical protein
VECGSVFLGFTSLLVYNCTFGEWGIVYGPNNQFYAIPPAYVQNGWGYCSDIDFSGWLWGQSYLFQDFGPTPIQPTH